MTPFYVDPITLDDLAEPWEPYDLPWLDLGQQAPHGHLAPMFQRDGYVILRDLIPHDVIDAYCATWQRHNAGRPMGWPYETPYRHHMEVERLVCHRHLAQMLSALIGEPMGVHLILSGWRSTQRNWHQDGYLNPDETRDFYAAAWIALDDIDPDSGPFEFIPDSHRVFPPIRNQRMLAALKPEERGPDWPTHSERVLTPLFERLMVEHDMKPEQFIAHKGDVLIWHARLLHRGSTPNNPELERRSCIAHYSGICHRPDFPGAQRHGQQSYYFPIDQVLA